MKTKTNGFIGFNWTVLVLIETTVVFSRNVMGSVSGVLFGRWGPIGHH